MATSSMGARENTVKKAMDAPKLMARSAHQPSKAAFKRRQSSASIVGLVASGLEGLWLAPSPEFDEILSCSEARRAAFGMARTPAAPLSCFPHGRQHSLPHAFTLFYDALR